MTLRPITDENRAVVTAVSVSERQSGYVAGVAESLLEAVEEPDAKPWYRAVYAGDDPVGFVMLSDGITVMKPHYLGPYFLWRLLIDESFQGRGYGRATIDAVVDYVRTRPGADVLLTSCVAGDGSPQPFYLRYGFTLTGEQKWGEDLLRLDLGASSPDAAGSGGAAATNASGNGGPG